MNRYLAELRARNFGDTNTEALQELQKDTSATLFAAFAPPLVEVSPNIATVATAANDDVSRCWRVLFPDLALEVMFTPPASRAEVAALYPGAELELYPEPSTLPDPDDRRTCEQCANLDRQRGRDGFRRCAAARRGELPAIGRRDYSPVVDRPMRCEGYAPRPDDHDRRPGRERWPGLMD